MAEPTPASPTGAWVKHRGIPHICGSTKSGWDCVSTAEKQLWLLQGSKAGHETCNSFPELPSYASPLSKGQKSNGIHVTSSWAVGLIL